MNRKSKLPLVALLALFGTLTACAHDPSTPVSSSSPASTSTPDSSSSAPDSTPSSSKPSSPDSSSTPSQDSSTTPGYEGPEEEPTIPDDPTYPPSEPDPDVETTVASPSEKAEKGDVNIYFYSALTGRDIDYFYFWKNADIGSTAYSFAFREEKENVAGVSEDYLFSAVHLDFGVVYGAYRNFYLQSEDEKGTTISFSIDEDDFFSGFLGYSSASESLESLTQTKDFDLSSLTVSKGMDIYAIELGNGTTKLATSVAEVNEILTPTVGDEPIAPSEETAPQDFNIYFYSAYGSESRNQMHAWNAALSAGVDFAIPAPVITFPELGDDSYRFSPVYLDFGKTYEALDGTTFTIDEENFLDGLVVLNSANTANDKTVDITLDKSKLVKDEDGRYNVYIMEYGYGEGTTSVYYDLDDIKEDMPKDVSDETEGDVNIYFYSTYAQYDARDRVALWNEADPTKGVAFDAPAYNTPVDGLDFLFSGIHLNLNQRYDGYYYDGSSIENDVAGPTTFSLESADALTMLKVGKATEFTGNKTLAIDLSAYLDADTETPVDIYVLELDYSTPMVFGSVEEIQSYLEELDALKAVNYYYYSPKNWDMLYLWNDSGSYSFFAEDDTLSGTDKPLKSLTLPAGESVEAYGGWYSGTTAATTYTLNASALFTSAIVRSATYSGDANQSVDLALPTVDKDADGVISYYILLDDNTSGKAEGTIYTDLDSFLAALNG